MSPGKDTILEDEQFDNMAQAQATSKFGQTTQSQAAMKENNEPSGVSGP